MFPEADPRSWNYPRKYTRPPLKPFIVFFYLFLFLFLNIVMYLIWQRIVVCLLVSILIIAIKLKYIFIWIVSFYQHFAPISVRSMCRFEPSCSEYMILAIKKYGAIRGVRVGLFRIIRCAKMDGGFDYP